MKIKKAIEILKMLPEDFSEEIEKFVLWHDIPQDSIFRIANAGSMNPGKSSLFNAILGKSEVFATSDIRQTTVCQEVMWKQGVALLDTPGCDSIYPEDEKESVSAFRKADYILFVHNVRTGGLNSSEINILKLVQRVFGFEEFKNRVCIVCIRSDSVARDALTCIKTEIERQIKEYFDCSLKLFCVSAKHYFNGIRYREKGEMMAEDIYLKKSNMSIMIEHVENARRSLGKRPFDWNSFAEKLLASKKEQERIIRKNKTLLSKAQATAKSDGDSLLKKVKEAWKECVSFDKKLKAFDNQSRTIKSKKSKRNFLESKYHDSENNLHTTITKSVKIFEKATGIKLGMRTMASQYGFDSFETDMNSLISKIESAVEKSGTDIQKEIQDAEFLVGQINEILSAVRKKQFEQ